jgi:uncharacterized protein (DUF58 family)
MKVAQPRWPIQLFRISALVVPSALAWDTTLSAPYPTKLTDAVPYVLGPLWVLMAAGLLFRFVDALRRRRRARSAGTLGTPVLDQLDVLTESGAAMAWLSAGAIMASVWVGWASLAVVGLMGLGTLHLLVIWTQIVAGGEDPWRRASLSRRFSPESVVEGGSVIEEIRLSDVRIPTGFRLLASGRVGPRWSTSRYAVESAESGGEVLLESDVGPALRGEHEAEPLEVWLQDVLGLCRSARALVGAATLTVLPRTRPIDGARALLGKGGSDRAPVPEKRLPTEGSFRLREYQPGDDARRIHWVRSLTARELVVRLPDEVPPDQPAVRLVLDTFLPGAEALACPAPAELLDGLVEVWLGVARALAEGGARVTLVTAAPRDGEVAPVQQRLLPRTPAASLKLGARVRWQDSLPVESLLGDVRSVVVSFRLQPILSKHAGARWIIVPESAWTLYDDPPLPSSSAVLPHPMGSPENRGTRRRLARVRQERARRDHATLTRLCADTGERQPDALVARPAGGTRIRLEALR